LLGFIQSHPHNRGMTNEKPVGISASALNSMDFIGHAFFTRQGGVSKGIYGSLNCGSGSKDDLNLVRANRASAVEALGGNGADAGGANGAVLVSARQIHSSRVVVVDEPWEMEQAPEADGLVTRTPNVALGVLTADCGPVLFADSKNAVIGAAHAGWRGGFDGILEATFEAMTKLGARPETTVAAVGPSIGLESYEVGEDFRNRFIKDDKDNVDFFRLSPRRARYLFDLPEYLVRRLSRLKLEMVESLALDTFADEESFFSFRRATLKGEADYGRMLSAIVIKSRV
jgi:polyphenol oxidase